jgi:hypothetical protein
MLREENHYVSTQIPGLDEAGLRRLEQAGVIGSRPLASRSFLSGSPRRVCLVQPSSASRELGSFWHPLYRRR